MVNRQWSKVNDHPKSSMSATKIARLLLEVKAVRLRPEEPFTWSSGWKSPIYCDNRIALSYPEARTYIRNELAAAIQRAFPDVQAIAGVATAGIAQGALVADVLNLPFLYVRPEPKKHGMGNQIEGRLEEGQRVVVIEDLISTGGSSLKVVDVLRQAGADVLGMAAIFTYGFPIAEQNFVDKNVKLVCLSDYETLVGEARELNYIAADATESLAAWRQNPAEWSN